MVFDNQTLQYSIQVCMKDRKLDVNNFQPSDDLLGQQLVCFIWINSNTESFEGLNNLFFVN